MEDDTLGVPERRGRGSVFSRPGKKEIEKAARSAAAAAATREQGTVYRCRRRVSTVKISDRQRLSRGRVFAHWAVTVAGSAAPIGSLAALPTVGERDDHAPRRRPESGVPTLAGETARGRAKWSRRGKYRREERKRERDRVKRDGRLARKKRKGNVDQKRSEGEQERERERETCVCGARTRMK